MAERESNFRALTGSDRPSNFRALPEEDSAPEEQVTPQGPLMIQTDPRSVVVRVGEKVRRDIKVIDMQRTEEAPWGSTVMLRPSLDLAYPDGRTEALRPQKDEEGYYLEMTPAVPGMHTVTVSAGGAHTTIRFQVLPQGG